MSFQPARNALLTGLMVISALAAHGQGLPESGTANDELDELLGVGVTEKLNNQIPLDLQFTDSENRKVTLEEYFEEGKPVVLTLIYYNCPMLCNLVINGAVDAMEDVGWTPGKEYEMLTVSFDPLETPSLSKLKKIGYVRNLGIPEATNGWHFLTGDSEPIAALTDAVGFDYKWNDARQEWAHTAVVFVLTPDGLVSRYLYGVMFDKQTFKLSLVEAAEGKIGTPMDQVLLYCFSYDAAAGAYAPVARNIMKVGGILVLLFLGTLIGSLLLYERRKKQRLAGEPGQ